MNAHDETQRMPARPSRGRGAPPDATTTQIRAPRPLDLAGAGETDTTGVLPLEELFERSDPVRAASATSAPAGRPAEGTGRERQGPGAIERMLDDAAGAWDGAVRRGDAWMRHGDNALMAVTALAAIVLILVVATFGH